MAETFSAVWDEEEASFSLALQPITVGELKKTIEHGEWVELSIKKPRSSKEHRHYFACIKIAWDNLSDKQREKFPTPEHLRHRALIAEDYFEVKTIVINNLHEIIKLTELVMAYDDYALVVHDGSGTVDIFTAQSQSMKAMGAEKFRKSKQAVLEYCANLIGIGVEELTSQGKIKIGEKNG